MSDTRTGIMGGAEGIRALRVVVHAEKEVTTEIAIETIEEGTTGRGITDGLLGDLQGGHLAGPQEGITGVTGETDIDRICCYDDSIV